jgi:hypothetical protein
VVVVIDSKQLELLYFSSNKTVPYNLKCGVTISIYPIRVIDWNLFCTSLSLFSIEKVDTDDLEVLKLSYLDFLIYLISKNKYYEFMLYDILSQSLKENNIAIDKSNNKNVIVILNEDNSIKSIITSKELEDIKKIIFKQNIYDYDDRYISPDIKREMEAYNKIKYKDIVQPDFEKKKVFVMSKNGIDEDSLNKMFYRTFSRMFKLMVDNDIYFANKMIEASPKYDITESMTHPLFAKEEDATKNAFTSVDKMKSKIK